MLGLHPTGKEYCNIVLVATAQLGRTREKFTKHLRIHRKYKEQTAITSVVYFKSPKSI